MKDILPVKEYVPPEVEVQRISVERGFFGSGSYITPPPSSGGGDDPLYEIDGALQNMPGAEL